MSREGLGFRKAVLESFAFLQGEFGFSLVKSDATFVRFEAPTGVFVNVFHGRSSFEIKFEVGQRFQDGGEEIFDSGDLAASCGMSAEQYFQGSTEQSVQELVPRLAQLLRSCGEEVLRGDRFAFKRLRDQQRRSSDALLLSWALEDARKRAAAAWKGRDFETFIAELEPLLEHLSKTEVKKLEYARSHQAGSS